MKRDKVQALQDALEAMRRGESPDLPADLRPLLAASRAAASLREDVVPPQVVARSRRRFLSRASRHSRPAPLLRRLIVALPRHAATAIIVLAVAVAGAGGLSGAAAQSLPGDPLYAVKLAAEDLTLLLSSDEQRRLDLESIYTERRVEEVLRLLALGRVVPLSFTGPVVEIGPLLWNIAGVPVRLTPTTEVLGEILPGMAIEVDGLTQPDGVFLAHRLHLREYDVLEILDAIDEQHVVLAGASFRLTSVSRLESGLHPGDLVLARIAIDEAGERSVLSLIRFTAPTPTAVPPTPTAPPATATPWPTAPLTPTLTPDPPGDDDGADDDDDEPEVQKLGFEGIVQSIGSTQWTISGKVVRITGATEIRDDPTVGDRVRVEVLVQPDGTWIAERIEVDD